MGCRYPFQEVEDLVGIISLFINCNVSSTFNKEVLGRIAPLWDENMSTVEKWDVLCDGLVDAGSELLGRDC